MVNQGGGGGCEARGIGHGKGEGKGGRAGAWHCTGMVLGRARVVLTVTVDFGGI